MDRELVATEVVFEFPRLKTIPVYQSFRLLNGYPVQLGREGRLSDI